MLVRFVISNFLSFDKEVEFKMFPAEYRSHKHHVYDIGKINVLKSAAIYGANGAGKSNFIKAIEFLQDIVSRGNLLKSINHKKFKLNNSNEHNPINFELEICVDEKLYSYGVNLNGNTVQEEWLYETNITTDDKLIFERQTSERGKTSIKIAEKYKRTEKQELLIELLEENILKENDLLLGKTNELNYKEIKDVRNHIINSIIIIHPGWIFR